MHALVLCILLLMGVITVLLSRISFSQPNSRLKCHCFQSRKLVPRQKQSGYRACNPSVSWNDQGGLTLTYRETNVHFDRWGFLAHLLRWKTGIRIQTISLDHLLQGRMSPASRWLSYPNPPAPFWLVQGWHDPRVIVFGGETLILTYTMVQRKKPAAQMHLLTLRDQTVSKCLALYPSYEPLEQPQKNWNFFSYQNELFVVTRIEPHQIAKINRRTGQVDLVYETSFMPLVHWKKQHQCKLHGGTALIAWKPGYLLGVGHVKNKRFVVGQYQTVFYLCQAYPPFALVAVTQPCVFPFDDRASHPSIQMCTGLIRTPNDQVILTVGVQDAEMWVLSCPVKELDEWIQKHVIPE